MSDPEVIKQPWSTKSPQRYVLSAVMIVLAAALVATGLDYISSGVGGVVPYLIVVAGPLVAIFYIWYFFRSQSTLETD